jgi:hypothetical protein
MYDVPDFNLDPPDEHDESCECDDCHDYHRSEGMVEYEGECTRCEDEIQYEIERGQYCPTHHTPFVDDLQHCEKCADALEAQRVGSDK